MEYTPTNFEKEEKPHCYHMSVYGYETWEPTTLAHLGFEWTPLPNDTWAHEVFLNYYKFMKMVKEKYDSEPYYLKWNPEIHVDYYDELFDKMENSELESNPVRYQQVMAELNLDGKEVSNG